MTIWTIGPGEKTGKRAYALCLALAHGDYYRASALYRRWLARPVR